MQRKILIITNRIPYPLNDGGNLAMDAMIEGYHNAGWQVSLLSMNTSRHYVEPAKLTKMYRHIHSFEWMDIDNKVSAGPLLKNLFFSRKPEHVERFYHLIFQEKIIEILKLFKPDVVQVESIYLTSYIKAIKDNAMALTVLRVHNLEYHVWYTLARKIKNPVKKLYFINLAKRIRIYEMHAWTKYDLLLPIAEKDGYAINRFATVKALTVIPFSITLKQSNNSNVTERWVGYHIGAMDWIPNRDGVKWFIEKVWRHIHASVPDFEFYFAGRSMPGNLKELEIEGVHCMDEVPSAEDFIADKKILIVPIWSGSGIRIKILEAMAAGKVVISTVAGIKGIDAKQGEHFLMANSSREFVKAIKWCLENKDKAEEMAQNAKEMVLIKYEQHKVFSKVIEVVEKLLAAKG